MENEILIRNRGAVFESSGGEVLDLAGDFGMGEVGGVDGEAKEGVGTQGLEEEAIPGEADCAAPGGADAPAEGLGMVDAAGGEVCDGFEAGGVGEAEIARGFFAGGAQEPGGGDEAGWRDDRRTWASSSRPRVRRARASLEGDVEEFAFIGGVLAGEEAGEGGFLGTALR